MPNLDMDFFVPLLAAYAGASNADDFCKHLVHKVLRPFSPVGALIGSVGSDSKCHSVGSFGGWDLPPSGLFDLVEESPVTEAMRTGTSISINSKTELEHTFPTFGVRLHGAESLIFSPFEQTSRAIGFLALGFSSSRKALKAQDAELKLVVIAAEHISISSRKLSSNNLSKSRNSNNVAQPGNPPSLSDRQITILNHMSAGKTNYQIARLLNLSESTIKQESVRIFSELEVSGRLEASDFAKQIGLI
jgi:DNA-binding NarL/FixJ family response regulator